MAMRRYEEFEYTLKFKGGYVARFESQTLRPKQEDWVNQKYKSLTLKFVPTMIHVAGPVGSGISGPREVCKMMVTLKTKGKKPVVLDASDEKLMLQVTFNKEKGRVSMIWQEDEDHTIAMNATTCKSLKAFKKNVDQILGDRTYHSMDKNYHHQLCCEGSKLFPFPPKKQTEAVPVAGNVLPEEEQKEQFEINSGAASTSDAATSTPVEETMSGNNGEAGDDSDSNSISLTEADGDKTRTKQPHVYKDMPDRKNVPAPLPQKVPLLNAPVPAVAHAEEKTPETEEETEEEKQRREHLEELRRVMSRRVGRPVQAAADEQETSENRRLAESNGLENAFSMLLMLPLLLLLIFVFKRFSQSGLKNNAEKNEECDAEVDEHVV